MVRSELGHSDPGFPATSPGIFPTEFSCCFFSISGLCVLVLLETAAAQNPKDSQCHRQCPWNAACINATHCTCDDGFASSSGEKYFSDPLETCHNINECVPPISASCGQNAKCVDREGSYHCTCVPGYALPSGEKRFPNATMNDCQDVNECGPPISIFCGQNANCVNIKGSYHCSCSRGHALPSGEKTFPNATMNNCRDIDECQLNPSACKPHEICINKPGSYKCKCKPGFAQSNKYQTKNCADVNECAPPISISCGQNANCVNTEGSYHCTCKPGYGFLSGEETFPNASMNNCQDVNECAPPISISCGQNADCVNTEGSYYCSCNPGYALPSGEEAFPNDAMNDCQGKTGLHSNLTKDTFSRNSKTIVNNLDIRLDQVNGSQAETAQRVTLYLETVQNAVYEAALNLPLGSSISKEEKSMVIHTLTFESGCNKSNSFRMEAGNERMDFDCIPTTDNVSKGAAVLISYDSIGSIINERFVSKENLTTDEELINFQLNSKVVSGAIGYRKGSSLSIPVNFTFQYIKMRSGKERPLCVYWNKTFWSNQGCKIIWYNDTQTVCSCTHLSSFAILMASVELEEDPVLTMITYVGLSLSLLCLFLAALTFLLCRAIKGTSTFLHLQLSLCLFLANLIFLIGIKQTRLKIVCSLIAGGLHYLYLTAFTWMFLEGLHLFLTIRNLKVVNYTSAGQFKKRFMCPFGYGMPAVIVAVSAASSFQHYGTDHYCWLNIEKGFIWSFIGPVFIIILINLSFYLITLWILRDRLSSLNKEVSTIQNTRTLTIKALAQLFILGCSWSLGFFMIDSIPKPVQSVIAYTFTIINSLQGVYIFLVHCVLSRQVQEEYKKCFKRIKGKTETDIYMLSTSNSHSRMLEK
ncbi:adhesion G protein-coupled receptor E3-like [Notamacropus eugenii]|uniref:adhesion G protein-coupled receptor E3-like n=1 Tax=Notamacropus eugenii TaxID=9315 RepID=UPI003B6766F0